jgi:uncharacterized delta-60 repeat protein
MKTIFFFITLIFLASVSNAQPGTLDKSFGNEGKIITNFGLNTFPKIVKAVIQSDDKIIEVGHYYPGNVEDPYGFLAVRYTADGVLDYSYGDSGKTVIQLPFEDDIFVSDVAIQKDDKILLAGYGKYDYFDPVSSGIITRLKTDGSVDSSFGINGTIQTTINKTGSYGSIAVQTDGKIVVSGGANNTEFINRFLPDGKLDNSFGENGYTYTSSYNAFFTSGIQTDGKIVMGGYNYQGGIAFRKFCLQRYLPDGTLDKSFGDNGTVLTAYGNDGLIHDLAFQSDGKIVVTGETTIFAGNFPTYFATARYNQDGSLDNTFGTKGMTTTTFESSFSISQTIAINKDNSMIIGGPQGDNYSNFTMVKLTANGGVDSTFGANGIVITDFGYYSSLASLLLQTTGKIVAAGTGYPATESLSNCLLARYNNDDVKNKKQQIISKIRRWLQHHNGFTWDANNNINSYVVQRSYDGIHWSTVHGQQTTANSQRLTANSYYYNDPSPLSGNNYYRLQTTSVNGAVTNSNILAVTNSDIKISPNPATNNLQLQGLSSSNKTKLTVVDFSGNVKLQAVANNTSYNLNIASLKPGNYLVKIEMNDEVVTKKFVKE